MLPLFSDVPLPWDTGAEHHARLLGALRSVSELDIMRVLSDNDTVHVVGCSEPDVVAYHRCVHERRRGLLVALNMNDHEVSCVLTVEDVSVAAIGASDRCSLHLGKVACMLEAHSALVIATHLLQAGTDAYQMRISVAPAGTHSAVPSSW